MTNQAKLIETLEAMIDQSGLYNVVEALELVCYEKSEHLQINWQDQAAAKRWNRAAKAFNAAHAKLEAIQLP